MYLFFFGSSLNGWIWEINVTKCVIDMPGLGKTFHLLSGSIGRDNITPFADPPVDDVGQM